MKLSDFFPTAEIARDAEFGVTLHPRALRAGALCYALNEATLLRVKKNGCIAAVLTTPELASLVSGNQGVATPGNVQRAYYEIHNQLFRSGVMHVHSGSSIAPTAKIAPTAVIGHHVRIGERVNIGHGVILADYTIIEEGTTVADYAVIGARGMQNTKVDGHFFPVEWAGGVHIGRNCEILTAAIIQRPYHAEYTVIGDEARISVKANVGHGVHVGERTMIGGNAQIGGGTTIGADAWIGQASVLADGLKIGDKAEVKMGSVVVRNVAAGKTVSGNFAYPHEQHLENYAKLHHG